MHRLWHREARATGRARAPDRAEKIGQLPDVPAAAPSYNTNMDHDVPPEAPHFATAGVLLDALASHDFEQLEAALDDDASMSALLPSGFREWAGAAEIGAAFGRWFGDARRFEVVDASVGHIGSLLELRWRCRLEAARFDHAPMVVEQHAFASTGPSGRVCHISLLCSGFWREHPEQ